MLSFSYVTVVKDPPYVIKESGYAGFNLTIDVYLKNRDEPKKITFTYDLNLQINLPFTNIEDRSYIFHNPSSEFRRKLLEGGGIELSSIGRASDDRSRDTNERSQPAMTTTMTTSSSSTTAMKKPSSDTTSKKHKKDRDEFKPSNTFANLFGTPITKISNTKVSPDQKTGSSNNPIKSSSINSTSTISSNHKQTSQKSSEKSVIKDKTDKLIKEKKDKTKYSSSPMKDNISKDMLSKRSDLDEKCERREEKRKEKSHKKDRERGKDKSSKDHISPKRRSASPKRSSSPMSRSSSINRPYMDSSSQPAPMKSMTDEKGSSSSGVKKSKKDKREKSLDKDRMSSESRKEKDCKQQPPMSQALKQKDDKGSNRGLDKSDSSTNKRDRDTGNGSYTPKESKDKSNKFKIFESKSSPSENYTDIYPHKSSSDSKKSEKNDKDSERKHKHKKKDKNKEKDRDNSSSSSNKDRKKEKSSSKTSLKDESESSISTPPKRSSTYATDFSPSKLVSNNTNAVNSKIDPITAMVGRLSEASTSESEIDNDYLTIPKNDKPDVVDSIASEHQNSSLPDVVVSKLSSPAIGQRTPDSIKKTTEKTVKKITKEIKTVNAIKDDKKRKRKTKNDKRTPDSETSKHTTPSPARSSDGPPSKIFKKFDQPRNNKDNSTNDQLMPSGPTSSPLNSVDIPNSTQHQASDSFTSTSSTSLPNLSNESFRLPGDTNNHDYLSELKSLQHKIMALQNNNELQQVVEMIAATGCYEITSKTFDFDLCALDRTTVQRLQDFFSQTQSGVL